MGCGTSAPGPGAGVKPVSEPATPSTSPFGGETPTYTRGTTRTIPKKVAAITKAAWRLEGAFKHSGDFEGIEVVSQSVFYSLIQQKAKSPKNIILYDVQSRMRYNRLSIKFALCPWSNLPVKDLENKELVDEIRKNVNSNAKDNMVLMFSGHADHAEDDVLGLFYADFITKAKPKQVLILEGDFTSFLERYPNAATNSPLTLPGPTELLYQPATGFCLYYGSSAVCLALPWLQDGLFVDTVILLKGANFPHTDAFTNVKTFDPELKVGEVLQKAAAEIASSSTRGTPTLVVGPDVGAAAGAVAWFMINLGFSCGESVDYIAKRTDFFNSSAVFDARMLRVLHAVESGALDKAIKIAS